MANIWINRRIIGVNLLDELKPFEFNNAKWSGGKLTASSPFRYDSSPSFFLNTEEGEFSGAWKDSGAYDDYFSSGNFPKLLSFLRNESYEETIDYLISKYDYEYSDAAIKFDIEPLYIRKGNVTIDEKKFKDKWLDSSYLDGRGIHPKVVELNEVFDNGNSIGIIWRDTNGRLATVKYRHKQSKIFWYEEGATPVNRLVYGLNHVIQRGIKRMVICEAEIDAMTWQSAGIFAVAVGGSTLNDFQADLIIGSGVEEIILGGDFDDAGERFNGIVESKLRDYIPNIQKIQKIPDKTFKDINEFGTINIPKLSFRGEPIVRKLII